MFKRVTSIFTVMVLTVALFSSCSGNDGKAKSPSSGSSSSSALQSSSGSSASSTPQSSSGDSAQSMLSSSSSSYPNPENDPLYVKAYTDYANNNFDDSIAVCDQAIAKDPDTFWAYNVKGLAFYFANGNSVADECIALIDKSLAIDPQYSFAYFNKARILKGLKRWSDSVDNFNSALKYDPNSYWSYYGIATVYADTNQTDLALEYLKKSIDMSSDCKVQARTEGHFEKYHDNPQFQAMVS